jgi:hypothetical protein
MIDCATNVAGARCHHRRNLHLTPTSFVNAIGVRTRPWTSAGLPADPGGVHGRPQPSETPMS